MGRSVIVNSQNFVSEVIDASFQCPVLIDFFATWCGPCQMLKPVLEALTEEYDFVLAKMDIDQNSSLAQRYGIEGVPDVRIVIEGKMRPGFVGFLPAPQIRDLLTGLGLSSKFDAAFLNTQTLVQAGNVQEAQQSFESLLQRYPDRPELLFFAAEFFSSLDQVNQSHAQNKSYLQKAIELLEKVDPKIPDWSKKATALKELLSLQNQGNEEISEPDRDFQSAIQKVLQHHYQPALELLLAIVSRDRKYRKDGARKTMILVFDLLGDDHELTQTYRKKLTRILY